MKKVKDFFLNVLSITASGLFRVIVFLIMTLPLFYCGFPWWVNVIAFLVLYFMPNSLGGILTLFLWVWSFIRVLDMPFSFFVVLYYIFFVLYLIFCFIPAIASLFIKNR